MQKLSRESSVENMPVEELVAKAAKGDIEALQELFNSAAFQERLDKVARVIVRTRVGAELDVEDLKQEALLKILSLLNSIPDEKDLSPWLAKIMLNILKDDYRRKSQNARDLHIVSYDKGWAIRQEGAERSISIHPTQAEAIKVAREIARAKSYEVIIHRADGRVRKRVSYRADPLSPKMPRKVLFPKAPSVTEQRAIKQAVNEVKQRSRVTSKK